MKIIVIRSNNFYCSKTKINDSWIFVSHSGSFDYSKWVANAGEGVENITYKARRKEK